MGLVRWSCKELGYDETNYEAGVDVDKLNRYSLYRNPEIERPSDCA